MGTKGSKRGEKEGRDGSSSHCIPTRHIPVHIWLQYTRSLLLTIPYSLSQTLKIWRSLTRACVHSRIKTTHITAPKKQNSKCLILLFEKKSSFLSSLSYQASFQQSCSGGTVGWLRVVKAAPLPRWLSTVACSHALPGKPDPNIYRHTHMCSHTEEQEVQRRLNLKMCVVRLEACTSLWREGKRVVGDQAARGGGMRQGAETLRDRWTGQRTQTDCLRSGQCTGRWERPSKIMQHKRCYEDTSQQHNVAWKVAGVHVRVCLCKCVCLLSKWSCLCLKLDCRLVLSLETGALISVWLCWLSFSSISTVQQEKPCGHTFKGAPGRDEESALLNITRNWKLSLWVTSTQNTLNQLR